MYRKSGEELDYRAPRTGGRLEQVVYFLSEMGFVQVEPEAISPVLCGFRNVALGLSVLRHGLREAEYTIERPCKGNGVDEEECQQTKIGQECV